MRCHLTAVFAAISSFLALLSAAASDQVAPGARETVVIRDDVHVREPVRWHDADYEIHGNVVFHEGGELIVENATVSLMCTYTREFRFQWEGGSLITRDVTIGGAQQDDKVYQTYFEIQHGAWESLDTTIRYSSGVTMGWTGQRVEFHATRLMAGPHPDSIIMSSDAADVVLKDSEFNISLAVSANQGGQGRLDLPANEPLTRVFDASNVPGVKYRLELVNTKVDLWWVFFSGIQEGGPLTHVVLGHCPRLIPSIIAYDLQGSLELPAPWPARQGDVTHLNIGNLSLETTGQPVCTWCWGLYLDGPKTDVSLKGQTNICELFLSAGRMVLEGDTDTYNALNACTTVEVGRRNTATVNQDEKVQKDAMAEPAELVMRNVALGRFAVGDAIVGQLTAHHSGRIMVQHARCASLKLITKGNGTISLRGIQQEGTLERIEQGGRITLLENEVGRSKSSEGKPLHVFSWEEPPRQAENLSGLIWIDLQDDPQVRHPRALTPAQAAEASRQRPPGCAALFIWKGHEVLGHPDDCASTTEGERTQHQGLWLDHGVARVRERVTRYFTEFKQAGGRLDYLVLDYEGGLSNWSLTPAEVDAILADPRALTLKAKLGFDNASTLFRDCSPPPYVLGDDLAGAVSNGDKPYMRWNRMAADTLVAAMNDAIYLPVQELFPKARASNYGMCIVDGGNVAIDENGHLETGFASCFGNRGSRAFYAYNQLKDRPLKSGQPYGSEPFAHLRWMLNNMRAYRRSTHVPFSPWICHKSWSGDGAFGYRLADNDYYQEMIYHLALSDADDFLYWNPAPWYATQPTEGMRKESDDLLLDACVRIINDKVGAEVRRCVSLDALPWDSALLVTGTKVGDGSILWRITVPRWDARVSVQPSGVILDTNKFWGMWYTSPPGADVHFELVKPE